MRFGFRDSLLNGGHSKVLRFKFRVFLRPFPKEAVKHTSGNNIGDFHPRTAVF